VASRKRNILVGNKLLITIAAIFLAAGIGVMSYPTVYNSVYDYGIKSMKDRFLDETRGADNSQTPREPASGTGKSGGTDDGTGGQTVNDNASAVLSPLDRLYEHLKSENERIYADGQADLSDAFSYEQPAVDLSEYGLSDNIIGFISLPSIDMELPIYLGANTANMKKGAVHLTNTSYPIGGENTNCVIAAHRGTSLVMFRNIHKIQIGDEIIVTNFREELVYRAVEIKIIYPNESSVLKIQPGRDLLTLSSCHPLRGSSQRYVVICERVVI